MFTLERQFQEFVLDSEESDYIRDSDPWWNSIITLLIK